MLVINNKSFSLSQAQNRMQNTITSLQQQLNRLLKSVQFFNIQKNFIIGYIIKDFYHITAETLKDLKQVVELTLQNERDQVISKDNMLELVVVLSLVCSDFQKHKIHSLIEFYEQCIMELFNDREYLKKNYFRHQKQKIKNKSKINEPKSRIQSQLMGMSRSKSHLAQCPICAVQIFHEDISVLTCGHIIHKVCFEQCMKEQILSKKFPLRCPFQQCKKTIQTQDIEQYLDKQLVDKYYEFSLHNYVDKNAKNMSWCPTAGCTNAFQFDDHAADFKCPKCKKQYCLKCKTQKHNGLTCEQNKQSINLSEEDKQFMQFVKGSRYKQCPKCKFWVQKSHGCCHMTCRCTYQFCYKCGTKYGDCNCEEEYSDYYGSDDDDYSGQDDNSGGDDGDSDQQIPVQYRHQHQQPRIRQESEPSDEGSEGHQKMEIQ